MRLLLDTHVLLWALITPKRLAKDIRSAIENANNEVLFSAASIWEIAIKATRNKLDLGVSPDEIAVTAAASGFTELPVRSVAAAHVVKLPLHHRDPFDRILVAQAITEPATLYTADAQLKVYSELVHCF
jgi:PIN domain nuclease of toxin-antitoxin system